MRGKLKKEAKTKELTVFTGKDGKKIPLSSLFSGNKRYLTIDSFFKDTFNCKVVKIALDIGATCPNLDGKLSNKGCTYCTGGSGDFAVPIDIKDSFNKGISLISNKWKDCKYMPYFQSYTNTYMSVDRLDGYVKQVIDLEDVVGISIATRPDCISDEMLKYLKELSTKTYLIVELGLQSANDNTLKLINRGHTYSQFKECFYKLKEAGIKTCVHIINGLINEKKEDMLNTAKEISKLKPEFLKIHLLYFVDGTIDTLRLRNGEIKPLTREEYIDITVSELELLPPDIVIERLTGDGDKTKLIAPMYSTDKIGILSEIDNEFKKRNTYQGKKYIKE